jgi:hypothetical protein
MKPSLRIFSAALLAVAGFLAAGGFPARDEGAKTPQAALVRKDLLARVPAGFEAPRRDIFRPGQAIAEPEEVVPEDLPEGAAPVPAPVEEGPDARLPEPVPGLTYIGYISSPKKTIALVILEGQALAVAEGEEVIPGVKIEKVSPDGIILAGPGALRTTVPLQGEES